LAWTDRLKGSSHKGDFHRQAAYIRDPATVNSLNSDMVDYLD
jgi:hypothetical protein